MSIATVTATAQVLAGILALLTLWLKEYYSQERKEQRKQNEIKENRQKLLDGDTSSTESRIDGVCSQNSGNAGSKGDEDIARELSAVYGVAVDGFSGSKDSGTSGKVQ